MAGDAVALHPHGDVPHVGMRLRDGAGADAPARKGAARRRPLIAAVVAKGPGQDDDVVALARGVVDCEMNLIAGRVFGRLVTPA